MPPQQMQPQTPPGDPKASLGFSNMLREHQFRQDNPAPQTPTVGPETAHQTDPNAPVASTVDPTQNQAGNQEELKAEITGLESRLMDELKTLREEMKTQGDGKKELADLKTQIESVLNSNE